MPTAPAPASALLEVEEQITALAVQVRAAVRDAAAAIDPSLPPFGLRLLRMLERCGPVHSSAAALQLRWTAAPSAARPDSSGGWVWSG